MGIINTNGRIFLGIIEANDRVVEFYALLKLDGIHLDAESDGEIIISETHDDIIDESIKYLEE